MGEHWTPERENLLGKLAADGLSATLIAAELGGVTRNAVIGKISRLGLRLARSQGTRGPDKLSARRKSVRSVNPLGIKGAAGLVQSAVRRRAKAAEALDADQATDLPSDQSPFALPILQAGEDQCRWPMSEPTAEMMVCGAKRMHGSYCARHGRIAYVKPDRRVSP